TRAQVRQPTQQRLRWPPVGRPPKLCLTARLSPSPPRGWGCPHCIVGGLICRAVCQEARVKRWPQLYVVATASRWPDEVAAWGWSSVSLSTRVKSDMRGLVTARTELSSWSVAAGSKVERDHVVQQRDCSIARSRISPSRSPTSPVAGTPLPIWTFINVH